MIIAMLDMIKLSRTMRFRNKSTKKGPKEIFKHTLKNIPKTIKWT